MLARFLLILLFSSSTLLTGGLAIYLCYRLFCFLVGTGRGRPVLLFFHACFTPLRELGHLITAVLFCHRVTAFRLLSLKDPDGELGYVEHSYNPQNPIARLGDWFFALGPTVAVLVAVLAVLLCCFGDLFPPFMTDIHAMEDHFDLAATLAVVGGFFTSVFSNILYNGFGLKLLGLVLLLLICLGAHIDPLDLIHALWGFVAFSVTAFLAAGLCSFFDPRLVRMLLAALNTFAVSVAALYLLILAAALFMVAFGAVVFLFRKLADIETDKPAKPADEEPYEEQSAPAEDDDMA